MAIKGKPSMKKSSPIRCLFVDIGGVLLTNGWDHEARARAAEHFALDPDEMAHRHHLTFDTLETGKLSLEDYLKRVVFHKRRPFSPEQFRRYMLKQSKPYPEMLELITQLKAQHGLKTIAVSNEGRELNAHRVRKFKLADLFDAFISSCFVHFRKPDLEFYQLALDIAQMPARSVLYLENTAMFLQVARSIGIRGVLHTDYDSTRSALASYGLEVS